MPFDTLSKADLRRSFLLKNESVRLGYWTFNKTIKDKERLYITDALGQIINLNEGDTSFVFILKEE